MQNLKAQAQHLPIGVFDSGVGGLTVLKSLVQQLPHESFLYLGDTARLPYGTKSPRTVIRYSIQVCDILVKRGIKMLVVACNTASTLALTALQEYFPDIPVIGVLEPGAQAACQATRNNIVAVIATEATIKARGYQEAITRINPAVQVIAKSCGLLVPLVEEGWAEGPIAEAIAEKYLLPLLSEQNKPDCLVLGCTHFPVMIDTLRKVIDSKMTIVDSAIVAAQTVANVLAVRHLQVQTLPVVPQLQFLVTDSPERFSRVSERFMQISLAPSDIELVDLMTGSVEE